MDLVQVAVAAPIHRLFSYSLPAELADLLRPGHLVEVPFGRARRRGVVVQRGAGPPPRDVEIKPVERLVEPDPVFQPPLLRLLAWAWEYYLAPPGEMVFAALPPLFRRSGMGSGEKRVQVITAAEGVGAETVAQLQVRAPTQAKVLAALLSGGPMYLASLCQGIAGARSAVLGLLGKGLVLQRCEVRRRRPAVADLPVNPEVPLPTSEQSQALAAVSSALDRGSYAAFLLHGVTGSGKTEIYLRAIGHAIGQNRGAILLVPEISLTPQLIARVSARFGGQVAVLHSGLGEGERLDEWRRLKAGEVRLAVGARSAVFAPVARLGLVIVDEEHDPSYKQSERLPYSGRDLAMVRAREERAVAVLGTATPSVESYAHALAGRSTLLTLQKRVQERQLPEVEVIDLKQELIEPEERPHTIGPHLAAALAETLDRGEQAILFLNRRGYSSFALCRDCGEGIRCRNCSVALVHHLKEAQLRCHYCGLGMPVPERCPSCGGGRVRLIGLGTEKCEEEVRRRFPGARVQRLDSDSVSGKGTLHQVLSAFARGKVDILVGTQMVTKGHDIPNVTLVGVLLADLGLQLPDFRAGERTFQLLLQVAGRAGRGDRKGRVVIQTFLPGHPSIVMAREHRFEEFFRRELSRRKQLGYPPARRLLMVRCSHAQQDEVATLARRVAEMVRRRGEGKLEVLGPVASPLARLRGRYRFQMLVKAASVRDLLQVAAAVRDQVRLPSGAKILFDMDPIDML